MDSNTDLLGGVQYASYGDESLSYGDYGFDSNGNGGDEGFQVADGEVWHPVILDLNGDGIELMELGSSTKFFDMAGDGYKHRTAWAGTGDAVLAIDADGDGVIDQQKEIVFTEWDPTATSDMQALRNVFDTNHNGQLDAGDDRFADFRVVVTAADGSTFNRTLAQAGIASINLTEDKTSQVFSDGSSIDGQTTYTKTNGTIRAVGTVTLAADANGYAVQQTKPPPNPDGSLTLINKMLAPDGSVASEIVTTTSADGLTRTMTFDDDGDGVVDRAQSDVTVVNVDNSRTRTLSNTDQTGVLLDRTTTTTSADKKTVTIERDPNGNGVVDQREVRVTNADGSQTVTITDLNPNGTTQSKSVATVSVDGQTRTTTLDVDGDGTVDVTQVDATVTAGDGTRTRTVTETNTDGSLRDRTLTISSADGSAQTVKIDSNGDNVYERVRTSTIVRNANGSTTTTDTDKSANGGLIATRVTTISANGQTVTTVQDLDGDGDTDLTTVDDTVVNASNRVQTITLTDGNGGPLGKTTITKGASNGLTGSTRIDTDGDGNDDRVEQISVSGTDVTDTVTTYSPDGTVVTSKTETKTTQNGLKRTTSFDYNGDGANDLVTEVATVKNANGSSTVTTSNKDRNAVLISKVETETSADGLTVITKSDVDGDGTYEFTTTKATVVAVDNSITTTETTRSENGTTKQSSRSTYINPTRTSTTIREDLDGDNKNDRVKSIVNQAAGTTVETLSTYSRNATLTSRTVTTTSADGLSATTTADVDGDGTTDLTTTDVTVLNADGSRSQTVSVLGPTSALRRKLTTTKSASGLSTTILEDLDGNGTTDLTTTDVTTILNSGYRQEDITSKAGTKVVGTKSVLTSRSGLSVTTDIDADGDGDIDTHTTDVTTLGADGSKSRTVTTTNLDATMRSKTQTVTSRDGKSVTIRNDFDGSGGTWDRVETIVKQADGKVVDTVSGRDLTTGTEIYRRTETTSANGTSWTRTVDENGDGVNDQTETRTLTYNADGSTRETYTDQNTSWNVAPGEYANPITKHTDISADGLSRTTTITGIMKGVSSSHTVTDTTTIMTDGGTDRVINATRIAGFAQVNNKLRITVDAHGSYTRKELDFWADGSVAETTEKTVNADGSVTDSFLRRFDNGITYSSVTDTSADGLVVSTKSDSDFDGTFDTFSTSEKKSDGSVIETTQYKDKLGVMKNSTATTTSFDGRTTVTQYDTDGDGTTDRSEETVTVINANGTKTTTRSEYGGAGALHDRIVSTTSANGLSITATIDLDGDGVVDETFSDVTTLKDDGSTARTTKTLYADGSKKNLTWIATSADGLTTTTRQDLDGDGTYDIVTAENTYASGMKITTVSRYGSTGSLESRDTTTVNSSGRITRLERDTNGDGVVDERNFIRSIAGQNGSYSASLQDFMNSDNFNVDVYSDELGMVWLNYTSNGYSSPLYFDTKNWISLATGIRSDLYDVMLDRDMKDVEGIIIPISKTFNQTMLDVLGGPEFSQKYGTLTNAQLIERLHENAYNRGATLIELNSWLTRLKPGGGSTKQDLVWDLASSAEHATVGNIHGVTNNTFNVSGDFDFDHTTDKVDAKNMVDHIYVTTLARHIAETNGNIALILNGTRTESQLANSLVASTEFQTKYGMSLSNQDFVAQMFQNGLGRAATATEKSSWATLLGDGTISRADFIVAIANSPDYQPGSGVSASGAMASGGSGGNSDALAAARDAPLAPNPLAMSAAPPVPVGASLGDQASMLRLVQAMASMTPQGASETTLPLAAIPVPQHQLASPLH